MTKKELLNGKEFEFTNERGDIMTVEWSEKLNKFLIWFNAVIIDDTKSFGWLQRKVGFNKTKHNLKEV